MKVSLEEAQSNLELLVESAQKSGRNVQVFQGEQVIALISPVASTMESSIPQELDQEVYKTWGESLQGL